MITSPETRELAQRLLAHEAVAGKTSEPAEHVAIRVYEKLRRPLCALAGAAGFWSLASRALALAKAETPSLNAARITTDGSLLGLEKVEPETDRRHVGDGGAILIAQLLGLLFIFIGKALTLRLLQDAWPDAALNGVDSANEREDESSR